MRKCVLSALLAVAPIVFCFAQLAPLAGPPEVKQIIPPSPDVASLGAYGDNPVNLYSGTPSINIPIYEASCGRLKLPVSLSYSGKGIKVEEMATWVGLGWTLNAGGIITRAIHGRPDENGYMNWAVNRMNAGDLIDKFPDGPLWYQMLFRPGQVDGFPAWRNSYIDTLRNIVNGFVDTESDMFYYNFGNYSGKFFYDQDGGNIVTLPQSNLIFDKAYFLANNKWKVTTPDGVIYYFDFNEQNTNFSSCDGYASPPLTRVTGWFLTRIEDPSTAASMALNYTSYSYSVTNMSSVTLNTSDGSSVAACARPMQICNSTSTYLTYRLTSITFDTGKIEFVANTDRCDMAGTKALDRINIYANNSTTPFVSHRFEYEYFNKSSMSPCTFDDQTMARLKLKGIYKVSSDGHEQPPHAFTYDESKSLPSRMSYSQDAWGYYNHIDNDEHGMVPPFDNMGLHYLGSDRTTDPTYTGVGMLNKIVYPTGGSTTYTFENHKVTGFIPWSYNSNNIKQHQALYYTGGGPVFSKRIGIFNDDVSSFVYADITVNNSMCYDCSNGPPAPTTCSQVSLIPEAGGATIDLKCSEKDKKIPNGFYMLKADFSGAADSTYYEGFSVELHWEEYHRPVNGIDESSIGGMRIKTITDNDDQGNVKVREYEYVGGHLAVGVNNYTYKLGCIGAGVGGNGGVNYNVRQAYSNIVFGSDPSASFGYGQVTEKRTSGGVPDGKSVYTYTTMGQFPDIALTTYPYGEPISFDHRRGLLLTQVDSTWKSNHYQILRRIDNEYKPLDIGYDWEQPITNNQDPLYRETYNVRVVNLDIWTDGTEPIPYPYAYKTLTEWVRQTKSIEKVYDDNGNFSQTTTFYERANRQHQQLTTVTSIMSDGTQIISRFTYPMDYFPGDSATMGIKGLQANHYMEEVVEKVITRKIDSSHEYVVSASLVGYNGFQLPATVYSLRIDKPLRWKDFKPSRFSLGPFYKDPNYEQQLSFNYDQSRGHLTQQQKTDDISKSYIWGYDRTSPIAEVTNATQSQIFHTSFEDEDHGILGKTGLSVTGERSYDSTVYTIPYSYRPIDGNLKMTYWYYKNSQWNFKSEVNYNYRISETGATAYDEIRVYPANAMMTTYCYKPGVGISSTMDANGRITTYEYDTFGRLIVIRDNEKKVVKTFKYHYKNQQPD